MDCSDVGPSAKRLCRSSGVSSQDVSSLEPPHWRSSAGSFRDAVAFRKPLRKGGCDALRALLVHVCGSCDIPGLVSVSRLMQRRRDVTWSHCLRLTCHSQGGISQFSWTVSDTEEPLLLQNCVYFTTKPSFGPTNSVIIFVSPPANSRAVVTFKQTNNKASI